MMIERVRRTKALADKEPEATVTVIIPCYNYAHYLPDAVRSVLSQEDVRVDVVIVDDASTDDSLNVARRLAEDPRVKVVPHVRNMGPVRTFNDGLLEASGEFLVRLDADDLLTPGSLRRAVAVMRHHPSVGLVYGHPVHFLGNQVPQHYRSRATAWTIWPGRSWLAARCRTATNVITSPEVLMRRLVVDLVGGQQPLAHTHDMEMWLRMSAFSDVAFIHGADQAWHREHAKSLSVREVDCLRDLHERREAFEVLFSGIAGRLPEAPALHDMAKAALAAVAVDYAKRQFDRPQARMALISALQDFARAITGDDRNVTGLASLERRARMGTTIARRHPIFVLERIARGLRMRHSRWQWKRTGEW